MRLKSKNKFGAKPGYYGGEYFHSKGEYGRYLELKWLEQAGKIWGLQRQVKFALVVNDVKVGSYTCDFMYHEDAVIVVEDFKGYRTDLYKLKKELFCALFPNVCFRESSKHGYRFPSRRRASTNKLR